MTEYPDGGMQTGPQAQCMPPPRGLRLGRTIRSSQNGCVELIEPARLQVGLTPM
jgi:hypothetical protein